MARKPSPWWWDDEQGWYVNYEGKRRFLGKQPEGAAKPQKSKKTGRWNAPPEIETAFRKLFSPIEIAPSGDTVAEVLDDFITWCKENRALRTALRYEDFCQDFINAGESGKYGLLAAVSLTGKHVTAWLNAKSSWGATTRKNAITALIRAFNWAVKNRGLPTNPIRGMEKPEAKRRSGVVTPDEFDEALALASPAFRDLLIVSYDCGARPFEIKELERRHIEAEKQRAVIPASEAKGRKATRVFYFPTERSMEVIRRLKEKHPEGALFRNERGNKWTGFAVKCAFARLEKKTGKRLRHYDLRRTFITRKIIAGVDSHVVAKLSGHQSTAMIDRHYSGVANDHEFMLKMAAIDIQPKPNPASGS